MVEQLFNLKRGESMQDFDNEEVANDTLVSSVKEKMPSDDTIYDLSELYKVFGDSTRTKILSALEISELCVCDIALCLNMTKSAVSHQLRILRTAKLVKPRKVGKVVYYSLDDDHVSQILECGLSHINEQKKED